MEVMQETTETTNSVPPPVTNGKSEERIITLSDDEYGTLQKYQAERNAILLQLGALEERKLTLLNTLNEMQNEREKFVHVLEAKYHLPSGVRWGVEQNSKKVTFIKTEEESK